MPMASLRAQLEEFGLEDVETYIQSGNVVFRSAVRDDELATLIEQRIAEAFGVDATVILRSGPALEKVAAGSPFPDAKAGRPSLYVTFLDREPDARAVAELDPGRSPPDEFAVRGREIYLHLPNGAGRTKLTLDYFERILDVRGTARNWRTVTTLVEMARARGRAGGR